MKKHQLILSLWILIAFLLILLVYKTNQQTPIQYIVLIYVMFTPVIIGTVRHLKKHTS